MPCAKIEPMLVGVIVVVENVYLKVNVPWEIDGKDLMIEAVGQTQMIIVVESGTSTLETVINCLAILWTWWHKLKS